MLAGLQTLRTHRLFNLRGRTVPPLEPQEQAESTMYRKDDILGWARDRGILANSTPAAQAAKTLEELEELKAAIIAEDFHEIKDAIGDVYVTLVIGAEMAGAKMDLVEHENPLALCNEALTDATELADGLMHTQYCLYSCILLAIDSIAEDYLLDFNDCVDQAWEQIKDRKGHLNEQGVFVKEST